MVMDESGGLELRLKNKKSIRIEKDLRIEEDRFQK
jgi:hypothetical protein